MIYFGVLFFSWVYEIGWPGVNSVQTYVFLVYLYRLAVRAQFVCDQTVDQVFICGEVISSYLVMLYSDVIYCENGNTDFIDSY